MFVNGEAMSGGRLHYAIGGATFLGARSTAPRYRFFSVRDEFPGLYLDQRDGVAVPGELYEASYEMIRERLLPAEPPELELGVIELDDGTGSLAMGMRSDALGLPGVLDISERGGWKAYRATSL
ncbi:MAG: hypothetical protein JWO62_2154 [Acidimicrobiaceae bacterium]|jgi:hypothetical protein|nr:hypothetical protein [Acidimicrobiaceae bacterium]